MYLNFSNFRGRTSAGGGTSLGPKTGTNVGWGHLAKFSSDWGTPQEKTLGVGFCGQNLGLKCKVYFMRRYPFMNNNGCHIYFILLPNLLVWKKIINIQKLVTHVTHCLSFFIYLYVCYTAVPDSFKAPGQPGARPVRPTTGIGLWTLKPVAVWNYNCNYGVNKTKQKLIQQLSF